MRGGEVYTQNPSAHTALASHNLSKRLRCILGFSLIVGLILCCELPWANPLQHRQVDFDLFLLSGRAAESGQSPYGPAAWVEEKRVQGDTVHTINAVNLNPPLSVMLFKALSRADRDIAYRIWFLSSLIFYLTAVSLLALTYRDDALPLRIAWACGIGGFWEVLYHGQIHAPLVLAVTLAWLLLHRGKFLAAGISIGLAASLKPHLLLWPLLIALTGQPLMLLAASVVTLILGVIPLFHFGPPEYLNWLHTLATVSWISQPGNASLAGLAARLGMEWIGTATGTVLVCVVAFWAWRRRPAVPMTSAISLVTMLLASPTSWTTYLPFLLPVFFAYRWSSTLTVAALILLVPSYVLWYLAGMSHVHWIIFGSLPLAGVLLVFVSLLCNGSTLIKNISNTRATYPTSPA
jgi:hypothetical protein